MKAKLISFVISQTTKAKKGKVEQIPTVKSAPHYFETTMPPQFLVKESRVKIEGQEGELAIKSYEPDLLVAEVTMAMENVFSEDVISVRDKVIDYCHEVLKKQGGKNVDEMSEEYSVFGVFDYEGEPEQFFKHQSVIAGLLKSEKIPLDEKEIEYTMSAQLKYAKDDLVIVDWDGAFIFDQQGEFDPTVELFQLANLQLLRYRILDRELDDRLHRVASLIEHAPDKAKIFFKANEINKALKETILVRSGSIYEFQALEREIKLIGDWYWARLYELISKKFKVDDWRRSVKEKLDALEEVYTIASQNFTVSWDRRAHIIELVGWYGLLIGWWSLLIVETLKYIKGD